MARRNTNDSITSPQHHNIDDIVNALMATLKDADASSPESINTFFDTLATCKETQTKKVILRQKNSNKKKTKVSSFSYTGNQKRRFIYALMLEDKLRPILSNLEQTKKDFIAAEKPSSLEEKANLEAVFYAQWLQPKLHTLVSHTPQDYFEIANWLGQLNLDQIQFFAKDALVHDDVRDTAFKLSQKLSKEPLYGIDNAEFPPQISAINPLIPFSSRQTLLEDKGYTSMTVAYFADKKTAYPVDGTHIDFSKPITLIDQTLSSAVYDLTGYMDVVKDKKDGNETRFFRFPTGDNRSHEPRKFVKFFETYHKNHSVRPFADIYHSKPVLQRDDALFDPSDYAFKAGQKPEIAEWGDMPRGMSNPEHFFLQQILGHLLMDNRDTIFSPVNRGSLDPIYDLAKSHTSPSINPQEKKSLLMFAMLMEPEMREIGEDLKSHQEDLVALLEKMSEPLLRNKARLEGMSKLSRVVSSLSNEELAFWCADPNLSKHVSNQLVRYLSLNGTSKRGDESSYFENDPRLSLVNPLIPADERAKMQEKVTIEWAHCTVLNIENSTITLKDKQTGKTHKAEFGGRKNKFAPGDQIKAVLVTVDNGKTKRVKAPIDDLHPVVEDLIKRDALDKKIYSPKGIEKSFSIFDQADPDDHRYLNRFKSVLENKGVHALADVRLVDPHHILGHALKDKPQAIFLDPEAAVKELIDVLDWNKTQDDLVPSLARAIVNGTPGVFYATNPDNPRKPTAYIIPRPAFLDPQEQASYLTGGEIKPYHFDAENLKTIQSAITHYQAALTIADLENNESQHRQKAYVGDKGRAKTHDALFDHVYASLSLIMRQIENKVPKKSGKRFLNDVHGNSNSAYKSLLDMPELSDLKPIFGMRVLRETSRDNSEISHKIKHYDKPIEPENEDEEPQFIPIIPTLFILDYIKTNLRTSPLGSDIAQGDYTSQSVTHNINRMAIEITNGLRSATPNMARLKKYQHEHEETAQGLIHELREGFCVRNENEVAVKISNDPVTGEMFMSLGRNPDEDRKESLIAQFNSMGLSTEERRDSRTGVIRIILTPGSKPKLP